MKKPKRVLRHMPAEIPSGGNISFPDNVSHRAEASRVAPFYPPLTLRKDRIVENLKYSTTNIEA